jgi:hypothetical protein
MNSSAGPFYGIFPLGLHLHELSDNPEKYLSKDCILTPSLTDDEWKKLTRKIEGNAAISDEEYELEWGNIIAGILPLGSQGCSYIHGIVLNGAYKGRVINLDTDVQKPIFTHEDNFLDWYERWLDEVILGKLYDSPSSFGYEESQSGILDLDSLDIEPKRNLKFWKKLS